MDDYKENEARQRARLSLCRRGRLYRVGAIQMDELTFVLTNDDYAWRIAGFSVGDLTVISRVLTKTIAQKGAYAPVKTAKTVEDPAFIR